MKTNRLSIASLVFAVLTIIFFCIGVIPIPLTAIPCFPSAVLAGALALLTGIVALVQMRLNGESGQRWAWLGIFVGFVIIVAVIILTTLTALAIFQVGDALRQNWPTPSP